MNDEEVDEFLEHHGVKGQKWGIRNRNPNLDRINRVANGTAIRQEREKAKSRRVAKGALVVTGALAITAGALLVSKHSNVKMSEITKSPQAKAGEARVKAMIADLHRQHKDDMEMLRKLSQSIADETAAQRMRAFKLGLPITPA